MFSPGQIVRLPNKRHELGTIKEKKSQGVINPIYKLEEAPNGDEFKENELELLEPEFELKAVRDSLDKLLAVRPIEARDYRRIDNLMKRELFLEGKMKEGK